MVEPTPTDTELLIAARESDVAAFRILFERYQPMLFRYVLFHTGERDLSHDIVQETFLRVWERRHSLQPHLSFSAYVFRISKNLARDAARHRQVREKVVRVLSPPGPAEGDNPEDILQRDMVAQRLDEIVTRMLPEKCRLIFVLSRYEGKTHREIATLLGLSVKTVENQVRHALTVIRRHLER